MAIKIPSKNIYQINNPKVRDNVIDNVSVEQKVVTPNNEYETNVYNKKIANSEFEIGILQKHFDSNIKASNLNIWSASKSYVELKSTYLKNFYIEFNDYDKTFIIDKVYYGKNQKDEDYIKYTVYYNKKKYNVNVSDIEQIEGNNVDFVNYNETIVEDIDGSGVLPNPEIKASSSLVVSPYTSSLAEIKETNLTNVSNLEVYHDETNKKYYLHITILVGLETLSLTGVKGGGGNSDDVSQVACSGEKAIYTPKSVEITLYGNKIGIDLTDGSITYGSGNKPYSLSGNELLQDSAKYNISNSIKITSKQRLDTGYYLHYFEITSGTILEQEYIVNGWAITPILDSETTGHFETYFGSPFNEGEEYEISKGFILITDFISSNVLNKYNKGKETATIRCSISDYYNESGEKVIDISTSNMSFRLHDEVIPYIYSANGEDVPMSKKQDGTPKVFEVVGSNIIYDGAVWQELTLQEK